MDGYVRSYNPRTSFGEHQFFIYIPAQDASTVFLPIVPTRLGDISITVSAFTLIGKDTVTRNLHVEVSTSDDVDTVHCQSRAIKVFPLHILVYTLHL